MDFISAIVAVATIGGFLFGYDSGAVNGTQEGLKTAFSLNEAGPEGNWTRARFNPTGNESGGRGANRLRAFSVGHLDPASSLCCAKPEGEADFRSKCGVKTLGEAVQRVRPREISAEATPGVSTSKANRSPACGCSASC